MDYLLISIMMLSAVLQLVAAYMASRLIPVTGRQGAWVLLSAGFCIQGIRRALDLYDVWQGAARSLTFEVLGLLITLLIMGGIRMIGPIFRNMKESQQALAQRQEELAKTHQELSESETRYRTVANFTSDWEFWLGTDCSIRYMSPSCEELSGYSVEDFYRDPALIVKIVHPDDQERYQGHTENVMENGKPRPIDFRIITRQGEVRWISHVCRMVLGPDGAPLGWRASNRDITERKVMEQVLHEHTVMLQNEVTERRRAQEALAEKQLQLEALNRTLEERIAEAVADLRNKDQLMLSQSRKAAAGEMIQYIAHQWKHPLNSLGLLMQSVRYEYDASLLTPEKMAHYMEREMDLISFMSQTIDDFKTFFREDKEKKPFSIRESITRALSIIDASLKANHIRVVVEQGEDLQVEGFRSEFAQALLNLLGNARDAFLERGVKEPEIRVKLFREDDGAVLIVSDNAGGIAEEVIDRVFDPYYSTKEAGLGTGIGLSMAKQIVEKNMAGRLSVRNTAGGAEFRIDLPL